MNDAEAQCEVCILVKIVISGRNYSGFGLSDEGWAYIGLNKSDYAESDRLCSSEFRSNPKLVECVEILGERANSRSWGGSCLKIIEIPDDVRHWHIAEYEGREFICEGQPIRLTQSVERECFLVELDGEVLVSRRIWKLDADEDYDQRYYTS